MVGATLFHSERRNPLTLLGLIMLAGLISLLLVGSIDVLWSARQLPEAFQVRACFNASTTGRVKLSAWWLSPQVRDAPRWAYVAAAYPTCATLPYLPFLPQSGKLNWP